MTGESFALNFLVARIQVFTDPLKIQGSIINNGRPVYLDLLEFFFSGVFPPRVHSMRILGNSLRRIIKRLWILDEFLREMFR